MKQKTKLVLTILSASLAMAGPIPIMAAGAHAATSSKSASSEVFVGDHLHTMSVMGSRYFMTGHESAAMSLDGGKSWKPMHSLDGADVMSWTSSSQGLLAGGHVGLFKSRDKGSTFQKVSFFGATSDVHAIGASNKTAYLGSPQVGLLASTDGGVTWKMRNSKFGQNFMGTMLVDPKDPKRVIAPDMSTGLSISTDGGITWSSLGGPSGPMAVAWNSRNVKEIAAIGMMNGGISADGGRTWKNLPLPNGAAAIVFSADGKRLVVGVLHGNKGQIFTSSNRGKSWFPSNPVNQPKKVVAMDPNMPGMTHVEPASANRPLALLVGTFGFGTATVFGTAFLIKRKDQAKLAAKKRTLASRGSSK